MWVSITEVWYNVIYVEIFVGNAYSRPKLLCASYTKYVRKGLLVREQDMISIINGRPHGSYVLESHFLRSPNPKCFFIYVDKVACTYLKHFLLDQMYGNINRFDPAFFGEGWNHHGLLHFVAGEVLKSDGRRLVQEGDCTFITFCRNPYDRFVSAYFNKILGGHPIELPHHQWFRREILRKLLMSGRYEGNMAELASGITLRHFAEYVTLTPEHERDIHWAEQWNINLADVLTRARMVRFEDFDKNFEEHWRSCVGEWPSEPLELMKNKSQRPRGIIDEDTAQIIYNLYRRDFELFGYDRESWTAY